MIRPKRLTARTPHPQGHQSLWFMFRVASHRSVSLYEPQLVPADYAGMTFEEHSLHRYERATNQLVCRPPRIEYFLRCPTMALCELFGATPVAVAGDLREAR